MADAIREQIMAAVKTDLDALSETAFRNLQRDYVGDDLPAVNLLEGGHDSIQENASRTDYDLEVVIEIAAAGAELDGSDAPALLNAVYKSVANKLLAANDEGPPFGLATVQGIRELGMDPPEAVNLEAPTLIASVRFEVRFNTGVRDVSI